MLPVSAGQFSSFVHDGEARPHPWTAARHGRMTSLQAMLAPPLFAVVDPRPPARTAPDLDRGALAAECVVFTRHLLGVAPAAAVVEAYVAAHERAPDYDAATVFDVRLVAVARRGPLFARLADAYARLFAPAGLLRRKLVLLLAILETTPPHAAAIDAPLAGGVLGTVLALGAHGFVAALGAVAAIVVLAPVHLASRGTKS